MTTSQLERAARHYCKLMGVDPDHAVEHTYHPAWKSKCDVLMERVQHFWAMNEALKEGMREDGDLKAESPST